MTFTRRYVRPVKLYFFPLAPNPTRVLIYLSLKEAGGTVIPLERVRVDLRKGEQKRPEHIARNPFGRLPVLELDDGTCLTESRAIMGYLEELYPEPNLVGANPKERAQTMEVERVAEQGVLYAAARIVHATVSPLGLPPNPALVAFYQPRLAKSLEVLEAWMSDGRPFLAGARPTMADCTMLAGLNFGRLAKLSLDPSLERLRAWEQRFSERPEVAEVIRRPV